MIASSCSPHSQGLGDKWKQTRDDIEAAPVNCLEEPGVAEPNEWKVIRPKDTPDCVTEQCQDWKLSDRAGKRLLGR